MAGPFRAIAARILRDKHPNAGMAGAAASLLGAPLGALLGQRTVDGLISKRNAASLVALVKEKPDSFLAQHIKALGAKSPEEGVQQILSTSDLASKVKEIEKGVKDPLLAAVAANRFALDNSIAKDLLTSTLGKGTGGMASTLGGIAGGAAGARLASAPGNMIHDARVDRLGKNIRNATLATAGAAGGSALAYKKYKEKKAQLEQEALDKEANLLGGAARLARRGVGLFTGRAFRSAQAMSHNAALAAGGAGLANAPAHVAAGFADAAGNPIYRGTYAAGNAESIGKGLAGRHGFPGFRRAPKLDGTFVQRGQGYAPVQGGDHLEQGAQVFRRGQGGGFEPHFTVDTPASIPQGYVNPKQALQRPARTSNRVVKAPAQDATQPGGNPSNPYEAGSNPDPNVKPNTPNPNPNTPNPSGGVDTDGDGIIDAVRNFLADPAKGAAAVGAIFGGASKTSPWASIDWGKYVMPAGAAVGGGMILSSAMNNRNNGG